MTDLWGNINAATSERTNAEVYLDKSRMNIEQQVQSLTDTVQELGQSHSDLAQYVGVVGGGGDYGGIAPKDDGIAPAAPTGVTVTPVPVHELDVTWTAPPASDWVVSSIIEFTPSGGTAFTASGDQYYGYAINLSNVSHAVRVAFIDAWGRQSGWSATVNATPPLTAAEQVDLDALSILGRLQGLLPNANLQTITDATKLGSGVVTAQAMAVQDAVAINLWVQNAAIQTAKIATLTADKIVTGTITAQTITLSSSGKIQASGGVTFDGTGIRLPVQSSYTATAVNTHQKISNPAGNSALSFYNDGVSQGPMLRADGNGTIPGQITVQATRAGSYTAFSTVEIEMQAGSNDSTQGSIVIDGNLNPAGGILMNGLANGQVPANGSSTISGFSERSRLLFAYQDVGNSPSVSKPLPAGGTDFGVFFEHSYDTSYNIRNAEGSQWSYESYRWLP